MISNAWRTREYVNAVHGESSAQSISQAEEAAYSKAESRNEENVGRTKEETRGKEKAPYRSKEAPFTFNTQGGKYGTEKKGGTEAPSQEKREASESGNVTPSSQCVSHESAEAAAWTAAWNVPS